MNRLFSPAKLNLFLHVVRRRDDGYHDLASLFQAIDLGDYLTISLAKRDRIISIGPFGAEIPMDASNLIFKAAALFRRKTGLSFGIEVLLEKNIPLQAGLGGGSSNAATTLWALNDLCGRPATLQDLIEWSGEIGSDITFFLSQGTAYCTSRGEVMQLLPEIPSQTLSGAIYIVKPTEGLGTAEVFKRLDLKKNPKRQPEKTVQKFYKGRPEYYNDLEAAALQIEPNLLLLKMALKTGGFETVVMTGTGTCFFCIGDGMIPPWPDLMHRQVRFIRRSEDAWYEASEAALHY